MKKVSRVSNEVTVTAGNARLKGLLDVPVRASGLVLFSHGSGSGRLSPRNQFVAGELRKSGIATFLLDLLDERELEDRRLVFDIDFLAERLLRATDWVREEKGMISMPIGYFGASTGAAAALQAAVRSGSIVKAVVSRGGRPDLAAGFLGLVRAPTLLIVGGADEPVIALNERAFERLNCEKELVIVPGATHLFEEPGTLERVAELASKWFRKFLVHPHPQAELSP